MKTSKKIILFMLILLTTMLLSCNRENFECEDVVCIENDCFIVELPKTNAEFMTGLMNREYLPENKGMLFIFQNDDKHGFWMKNTLIPLDIIWINKDQKIVHIETAQPCKKDPCPTYHPDENARMVLEINAGITEKKEIFQGQKVILKLCE